MQKERERGALGMWTQEFVVTLDYNQPSVAALCFRDWLEQEILVFSFFKKKS